MSFILVWIPLLIVFLVIEAFTLGLTTIWFAIGSFAAVIATCLGAGFPAQIIVFLVCSIVLMLLLRPLAQNRFNTKREKTNTDALIGQTAVVTEEIDNVLGTGFVKINGMVWSAKNVDSGKISKDEIVEVKEIQGVKLIVALAENRKGEEA